MNTVPVVTGTNAVTYESVPNAALANSSLTVTAGTGLSGGGSVSLGGSVTLSMANTSLTVSAGTGLTGGGTVALGGSVSLGLSSPVSVANGGTGLATLTAHAVMLGEGTSNVAFASIGTAGRVLVDQGSGADPAFKAISGDATLSSAGAVVNVNVNGVAYPASPATNTVPVVTGSNTVTYETVPVAAGGTGDASFTAYSVICGGTTTTGALQSVASVGTSGQVLTSNGAGALPTFQANAGIYPPLYIQALWTSWTSTTGLSVAAGYCVDSTNAVNIVSSSALAISTSSTGSGGMDTKSGAGTITTTNGNATAAGTSTSFLTAFGTRALTGTVTSSSTTVTGTGSKFLSQIAVNDLIGNATLGYKRVTAIASDTSLTTSAALGASTSSVNAIENPTIKIGSETVKRVTAIASNTSLTLSANSTGSTGASWTMGNLYGGDGSTLAYYHVFIGLISGSAAVVLSTQRTVPYASFTAYRRIAAWMADSSGNMILMTQRGDGNVRQVRFDGIDLLADGTRILAAGTATSWTTLQGNVCTPPTASLLYTGISQLGTNSYAICVRQANAGATSTNPNVIYNAGGATSATQCSCDGNQQIQYVVQSGASGYIDIAGYEEFV